MEKELKEKRRVGGGILRRTWERCKSFNHGSPSPSPSPSPSTSSSCAPHHAVLHRSNSSHVMVKSKSWSSLFPSTSPTTTTPRRGGSFKPNRGGGGGVSTMTPKGYLSMYVGLEKQRFVIKIECTSHPLMKMLLEEAESEYGFHNDGPLVLPCDVDTFVKVLSEMEEEEVDAVIAHTGCNPVSRSSYHLRSPSSSFLSFVQPL